MIISTPILTDACYEHYPKPWNGTARHIQPPRSSSFWRDNLAVSGTKPSSTMNIPTSILLRWEPVCHCYRHWASASACRWCPVDRQVEQPPLLSPALLCRNSSLFYQISRLCCQITPRRKNLDTVWSTLNWDAIAWILASRSRLQELKQHQMFVGVSLHLASSGWDRVAEARASQPQKE